MKRPDSYEEALRALTASRIKEVLFFVLGILIGFVGTASYIAYGGL